MRSWCGSVPTPQGWQHASVLRLLRADVNSQNSRWIGDVLHIRSMDIVDPEHAAEMLRRQPEVAYAQPNYIRQNKSTPNDTNYGSQWHFDAHQSSVRVEHQPRRTK